MAQATASLALLLAFATSALLARRFFQPESRLYILDHPNDRSLHQEATPRTGGLAILAGVVLGVVWLAGFGVLPTSLLWALGGMALLALVGFLDDLRGLGPLPRLAAHFAAAGTLWATGFWPSFGWMPGWLSASIILLGVVWMINLYNFMDGMDGFAGGMGVAGFGVLALLAWQGEGLELAWFSGTIALACLGFLLWNFPPARIFMGDAGSGTLGFLAALVGLWGGAKGYFSLWIALLAFSPFVVDASFTLARRLLRGERVWEAHREHLYQQLVQGGWSHRRTVLVEYLLMALCAAAALLLPHLESVQQGLLLVGTGVLYLLLILGVTRGMARMGLRGDKSG